MDSPQTTAVNRATTTHVTLEHLVATAELLRTLAADQPDVYLMAIRTWRQLCEQLQPGEPNPQPWQGPVLALGLTGRPVWMYATAEQRAAHRREAERRGWRVYEVSET